MSKAWIVFKSEFGRRVRSKWFILVTLLAPVFLVGLMFVPAVVGYFAAEGNVRTIAVLDRTGVLADHFLSAPEGRLTFVAPQAPADTVRAHVLAGLYDGYLVLPEGLLTGEGEATYYSAEGGGLSMESDLRSTVDSIVDEYRLAAEHAPPEVLQIVRSRVDLELLKITDQGETADSTAASSVLGLFLGLMIYLAMLIYGAYVMHGVMEEKQSRVLEVVVSSVRPFELLMGKVLGIGAMGLVQMSAWLIILIGISMSAGSVASLFLSPSDFNLPSDVGGEELLAAADFTMPSISVGMIVWFILFFLGGYLLYSSLFAAIGSSVEHQQDAQGLMMPVTLLIIIPVMFFTPVVDDPNTTLAVALSLFPFFAPILMVVRIAVTAVPFWQIAASFLLLCLTFVGTIWVCSRIYRVGILMYGKKPTLRDLVRWFRYQ